VPNCDGDWPGAKSATAWVLTTGDAYWSGENATAMTGDLEQAVRFATIEDAQRVRAEVIGPVDKELSERLVVRVRLWSGEQF
jgi:hypothetical protein